MDSERLFAAYPPIDPPRSPDGTDSPRVESRFPTPNQQIPHHYINTKIMVLGIKGVSRIYMESVTGEQGQIYEILG